VREREGRHRRGHASQPAHANQERREKQQVIVAAQDVTQAQREEIRRRPAAIGERPELDADVIRPCVDQPFEHGAAVGPGHGEQLAVPVREKPGNIAADDQARARRAPELERDRNTRLAVRRVRGTGYERHSVDRHGDRIACERLNRANRRLLRIAHG
jgi:hypothetical protein